MCSYKRLKIDPTSKFQTKNNKLVEKLYNENLISIEEKNKLTSRTAIAPRIYGLPKIHKEGTPLRPICSSINSPSYKMCRYITTILKNVTKDSKYNVKDAIDFKSKIKNVKLEDDEILISFDVVSLFPSIPVNLAIATIEKKWDLIKNYTKIPRDIFKELALFCIKDSRYFKYEDKPYEQLKGMPMRSPASRIIADIIMEELLDNSLSNIPKPRIITNYVDDIFAIIKKIDVERTLHALNSFHSQIQFTMELEKDNKLSYLDCNILRDGNDLRLNWYQNPTATGRLINYNSKHNKRIIHMTAINFIDRVLRISDAEFHKENEIKIKQILTANEFPNIIIYRLINRVKNKTTEKLEHKKDKSYKPMTYIEGSSERFLKSDIYNKDKIQIASRTSRTVKELFSNTKSKIKNEDKSNIVYKIKCNGDKSNICPMAYVGTTMTKLKTRLSSHKSDHKATDKSVEQKTALAAHFTTTGHKPNFTDVEILAQENNHRRRYTLEMLNIIDLSPDKRMNFKKDTEECAKMAKNA
ncbi:uncharacterized protein LOC142225042 [Haematobia irritans]|uniref:uncharacterized protein LOC142225042 n=1 Tax=Haematobia irritans TaxID=7368 RepID=UPI003F50385D